MRPARRAATDPGVPAHSEAIRSSIMQPANLMGTDHSKRHVHHAVDASHLHQVSIVRPPTPEALKDPVSYPLLYELAGAAGHGRSSCRTLSGSTIFLTWRPVRLNAQRHARRSPPAALLEDHPSA